MSERGPCNSAVGDFLAAKKAGNTPPSTQLRAERFGSLAAAS